MLQRWRAASLSGCSSSQRCQTAFFASLDMRVHESGHAESDRNVCSSEVNLSFSHLWPFVDVSFQLGIL